MFLFIDCAMKVHLKVFNSYSLCFHDIALWENFHILSAITKLASACI